MSEPDPPSRRDFEHLSAAVVKLTETIERLPEIMAATYVRQDVYRADQALHTLKHASQDDEIEDLSSWKDKVLMIIVSTVIVAGIGLLFGTGAVSLP